MKLFAFGICLGVLLFFSAGSAVAGQPEKLLGISTDFDKGEITLEVAGSGCTQKEDFRFELKDNVLTIFRKQRDACKAMPEKIRLTYKLKELGIDPHKPFRVGNLFIVNHNLANL